MQVAPCQGAVIPTLGTCPAATGNLSCGPASLRRREHEAPMEDRGSSDVWVMNADGSDPHDLTEHHGDVTGPTWSPDGTRIAYAWNGYIWIIGADGSGDHDISPADGSDRQPAWSPDGSRIAFISGS